MDDLDRKLLIICDGNIFLGLISIGDIQRALIQKRDLQELVIEFVRKDILYCSNKDDIDEIKKTMRQERIECMPIVDEKNKLIDIIEWEDVFNEKKAYQKTKNKYPVVIMAGGEGKRLRPLTNIIPKPLIPISDKTIIEEIIDRFYAIGSTEFYLSINYMSKTIKKFFENKDNSDYALSFIEENRALGTAGSLQLIRNNMHRTFFVSNCDVLVDVNYVDLLNYHKDNRNLATMVSVIKDYSIPYGTIETKEDGLLVSLSEKPTITYQINSGLYVLEPGVFAYMKEGEYLDITELLKRIVEDHQRVGVFPVSEKSYIDMGNWKDYLKLIEKSNTYE